MKRIWIVFFVFLLLVLGAIAWMFRERKISGTVVDCMSNQAVPGADVEISLPVAAVGDHVFWSRSLRFQSDRQGAFESTYRFGAKGSVQVRKKGYVTAVQAELPKNGAPIRLLVGEKPREVTYNCRLSSQCIQRTFVNDAWVYTDVCAR